MAFSIKNQKMEIIEQAFSQASVITPDMYSTNYTGDMNYGAVVVDVLGAITAIDHVFNETLTDGTVTAAGQASETVTVKVKDCLTPVDGSDEMNIAQNKQDAIATAQSKAHAVARDFEFFKGLATDTKAADIGLAGAIDATNILAAVTAAVTELDEAGAPAYGRFLAVTPAIKAIILGNDTLVNVFTPAGQEALKTGVLGEMLGFTIISSTVLSQIDMGAGVMDLEFIGWQSDAVAADFLMDNMDAVLNPNKNNTVNVQSQSRTFAKLIQVSGAVYSREA